MDLDDMPSMRQKKPGDVLATIDQYELIRELGGGGFGTVYLARDTVSGVEYAVKGLPPEVKNSREELQNIRDNFKLVSRLTHTNIARAYVLHPAKKVDYVSEEVRKKLRVAPGDTLMVMEYAPGITLSKWRKAAQFRDGKVPLKQALEIVRQVAAALDYAHGQKIIHRDIKPSNVMVETKTDGRLVARVLDFGLAAEIRSSMGRVSREVRDTSGTRPYMAPEQWLGQKQTAATDQYALAVLLYELLTGAVPFASVFESGDVALMVYNVTQRAPDFPGGMPAGTRAALEKALAKKPEERFPSCAEFAAAAGETGPSNVQPPDRKAEQEQLAAAPRKGKSKAKTALKVVAACLSLFAAGYALFWLVTPNAPAPVWENGRQKVQLWKDGPYWADRNVGADEPWDAGLYFWWGDTLGYKRQGDAWVASDGSSSGGPFDRVPTLGKSLSDLRAGGWLAPGNVLAPSHDAARAKWGGAWRMPTDRELDDLCDKCAWTWMTTNAVSGYLVRGRGKYAANRIFLPCAGGGNGTSLNGSGSLGCYWSSVPYSDSSYARRLYFRSGSRVMYSGTSYRSYGFSVRPVQGFTQ